MPGVVTPVPIYQTYTAPPCLENTPRNLRWQQVAEVIFALSAATLLFGIMICPLPVPFIVYPFFVAGGCGLILSFCARYILNSLDLKIDGSPALFKAVKYNSSFKVKTLLFFGANPNTDGAGITPLKYALDHNRPQLLETLISYGADATREIVDISEEETKENRENQITKLKWISESRFNPYEAFKLVIENNNCDALKMMLDAGFHPNAPNDDNDTALHIAVRVKSKECIILLKERGGNERAINRDGETPLTIAEGTAVAPKTPKKTRGGGTADLTSSLIKQILTSPSKPV